MIFNVRFRGLLLVPSWAAYKELEDLVLALDDVSRTLEEGFDCARGKRKQGVLERCLRQVNKVLRVVVAKDYNDFLMEDVWVVVHVSVHAWSKKFIKKEAI